MMNSLLTKLYNNYAIIYIYIYTQQSSKPSYIKYYNIIHVSHGQLTSFFNSKRKTMLTCIYLGM